MLGEKLKSFEKLGGQNNDASLRVKKKKKIASSCTFVYWCWMIESRSRWKWCHWDALLKCGMCGSQCSQGKDRIQEAELSQSFQNKIKFNALGQTFQRGQQEPHTIEHLWCRKNYLDMDVKHWFSLNQPFSVFKQTKTLVGLNVSILKY